VILHADLEAGLLTLVDPSDFGGFHVEVAGGDVTDRRLETVLAPHGRLNGDHAWIALGAVAALAGEAADDQWRAGFERMVTYARDNGFLDPSGTALRAHLETASPPSSDQHLGG
jgi:hypothetical protein